MHAVRTQILSDDSTDPEITVKVAAGQAEWGPLFFSPDLVACLPPGRAFGLGLGQDRADTIFFSVPSGETPMG